MVGGDEGHDSVEDMTELIAMGTCACNFSNLIQEEEIDLMRIQLASFLKICFYSVQDLNPWLRTAHLWAALSPQLILHGNMLADALSNVLQ